ncbi:hypothetical protein [Lentzea albida]|uniref:Uncharacterized protein n=1 Tax=Lentzea albida TaxID=65499 RepID=A0A1H9CQ66_9PSEU|nr:hypothetical protein [Lentzea albida]SEQ03207.1 hypothetical protein SAMN04488000_1011021 [Lentzea albida]
MSFPDVLMVAGLVLLVGVVLVSITKTGEEEARLRSSKEATGAVDRYAKTVGWTHVPKEEHVPAGLLKGLPDVGPNVAVAGTHEGRAVRVAVISSYAPSKAVGVQNGTTTVALVVVFDAPELPADATVDPGSRVVSALKPYQVPVLEIADGLACFTFTDLAVADELDHVVGLTHDVVKALGSVRNAE